MFHYQTNHKMVLRQFFFVSVLLSLCCYSTFSQTQVCSSTSADQNLVIRSNQTCRINESLTIVNSLILEENATLEFGPDVKNWELQANLLELKRGSLIDADGILNDGQRKDGVNIKIFAAVLRWGDFKISTSGKPGVNGANGAKGRKGRNGRCCRYGGGNGYSGNPGQPGSDGGNAGNIEIRYVEQTVIVGTSVSDRNFTHLGGKGGIGGKGGRGGDGGNKASGCFPGCNFPKGKRGSPGPDGANGADGRDGIRNVRQGSK